MSDFFSIDFGNRDNTGGLLGNAVRSNQNFQDTNIQDPGIFGEGSFFGKGGGASIALGGLKTLGSLWNSFQQQKLAKQTLNFQKNAFRTNLANSTKVFNNSLEDRIRARFATEGRSSEADAAIEEKRL